MKVDIDTYIEDADNNLAIAKQGMFKGRTESDRITHRNNNDAYSYILEHLKKVKERKKNESCDNRLRNNLVQP